MPSPLPEGMEPEDLENETKELGKGDGGQVVDDNQGRKSTFILPDPGKGTRCAKLDL